MLPPPAHSQSTRQTLARAYEDDSSSNFPVAQQEQTHLAVISSAPFLDISGGAFYCSTM